MTIDFSRKVTAEMKAEMARAAHVEAVKTACRRRIYAVLDAPTVANIQGAAIAGELDAGQMAVFRAGRAWVDAMLAACRAMADDPASDWRADASWPAVPDGVNELAARYEAPVDGRGFLPGTGPACKHRPADLQELSAASAVRLG